jgi:hypothetical protein
MVEVETPCGRDEIKKKKKQTTQSEDMMVLSIPNML